jgi:hypothetical protein
MSQFHLAQVNIGRIRAPLEDPLMDGFRTQLDVINTLADRTPGFVWRLQTDDGNAMGYRPFPDDDRMAINLSVWESLAALREFVYRSAHVGPLRDRKQWFEPLEGPILALWWVPAGHTPTIAEALDRLHQLKSRGPSQDAFTFREPFPAPGVAGEDGAIVRTATCEWAT